MPRTTKKTILILEACADVPKEELQNLRSVAGMLGMESKTEAIKSHEELRSCLNVERGFDYVYLCAHANVDGFGDEDGTTDFSWSQLASALCQGKCLRPGAILLLAGCRGGAWQVASRLFETCHEIEYVCGPRWNAGPPDLTTAFHVFLYNMEYRREMPSTAASRASAATGYDLFCYDRVELHERLDGEGLAAQVKSWAKIFLDWTRATRDLQKAVQGEAGGGDPKE